MRNACVFVLFFAAGAAHAASFEARMREANQRLEQGDVSGAMEIYRDLQIEAPDSGPLLYNMGVARYDDSTSLVQRQAFDDAMVSLEEARHAFDQAAQSPDRTLRDTARFGAAATTLQAAKAAEKAEQYEDAVDAFGRAVEEFEALLQSPVSKAAAEQNLNHARYRLKRLLQNPPPPPPPQPGDGGESDENQEGGEDGSQSQSGESGDSPGQQDSGEGEERPDEQDGQSEAPEQEGESVSAEDSEAGDDQPPTLDQLEEADQELDPDREITQASAADAGSEPPQMPENIEAILDSLEQVDQRELQDAANRPRNLRVTREWW